MTLTISPPLIQQLQPVFLNSRNIFQSRENNAKIYSWFAWVTSAIVVEIPYAVVAGGIYFCCWWWGIFGYRVSSFTSGFTFLLVILFELYYVSFGQFIAAFAPNELLASLLVPVFFLFVVSVLWCRRTTIWPAYLLAQLDVLPDALSLPSGSIPRSSYSRSASDVLVKRVRSVQCAARADVSVVHPRLHCAGWWDMSK